MTHDEIMEKLIEICFEVFENDELEITEETTAADIDEWDSLSHLSLINEIEMEFDFKFKMSEIQSLKNVGSLVEVIASHI